MGGPALQKQQTPAQGAGATSQANTQSQAPASGAGNQAAIDQLTGKSGGAKKPAVDMGAVNSGASFMGAASKAMDAAVPSAGSFASLKISGRIPIASVAVASAYIEPSLEMQLARSATGEFEVTLSSQIGLRAEAGSNGGGWWPKFMAYFKGYVKGSLKIVGDSAGEIMRQFMLTLRLVVEGACDAAGAPNSIKDMMSNGILSAESKKATIEGMDSGDSITASIGGGVEAGAEASVLGGQLVEHAEALLGQVNVLDAQQLAAQRRDGGGDGAASARQRLEQVVERTARQRGHLEIVERIEHHAVGRKHAVASTTVRNHSGYR
jgi:hypothetical protein